MENKILIDGEYWESYSEYALYKDIPKHPCESHTSEQCLGRTRRWERIAGRYRCYKCAEQSRINFFMQKGNAVN